MGDEEKEREFGLTGRVTLLENLHHALDKRVEGLAILQQAHHSENLGRFGNLENLSTSNGSKLDTLLQRSTFDQGKHAATNYFWKGISIGLGTILTVLTILEALKSLYHTK